MRPPELDAVEQAERRADRAADLLARHGAWLAELGRESYAVLAGADRRRRPLLTLDEAGFRRLVAAPGLKPRESGGWTLAGRRPMGPSPAGPGAGRPSIIEGERTVVEPDGRLVRRRANLGESPIDWLARRKDADGRPWLDAAEAAAGERLRDEFERCGRLGRLTMAWDAGPKAGGGRGPGVQPIERARAAKDRVRAALVALDPDTRDVVKAVCFVGTALGAAEHALGLERRSAKHLLKRGLAQLARHYRLG